jgi:hypothetical protein
VIHVILRDEEGARPRQYPLAIAVVVSTKTPDMPVACDPRSSPLVISGAGMGLCLYLVGAASASLFSNRENRDTRGRWDRLGDQGLPKEVRSLTRFSPSRFRLSAERVGFAVNRRFWALDRMDVCLARQFYAPAYVSFAGAAV